MENFIQQLLLVKDLQNLSPFAQRHEKIQKLNILKREAFNKNGISSQIFLSICAQLFDLYNEDEDYELACNIAINILQGSLETKNQFLIKEAQLNLSIAYLNNENIFDGKKLIESLEFDKDDDYYSQFCSVKSKLARKLKEKKEELLYSKLSYNICVKKEEAVETQINFLCSLSLCYERHHMYEKALSGYLELANQIAQNNYQLTIEQQISLEVRISKMAAFCNNFALSLEILSTSLTICKKILRDKHPLTNLIKREFKVIEKRYTNKNT